MSGYTLDFVRRLIKSTDDERIQLLSEVQTNNDVSRLINIVYRESYILSVKNTVNDLLKIFPEYQLDSRQQLYLEIAKKDIRNYEQIEQRMTELGVEELDYTGYIICNRRCIPNIYCPSNRTIDSYTLNFLWINVFPQDRSTDEAKHIFDDGLDTDLLNKYVDILSKWRDQNREAVINLWYDSALVTEKSYYNTVRYLNRIDVQLRDIRSLTNIPEYIEVSLCPTAQVYYRIDILKILVTDHMYSESYRYTVMVDMDVQPMTSKQLFDGVTLELLDKYGYLYTNTALIFFENSFSIFDTTNVRVKTVHREQMIDRIERILHGDRWQFGYDTVYSAYNELIRELGEKGGKWSDRPRKPIAVPMSQFNNLCSRDIPKDDYRKVVFTVNPDKSIDFEFGPTEILDRLRNWTAVPLQL